MRSPFLYFPDDRLSVAELSAACLDGHLVELGEGYLPADAVETPGMRAASLRSLLDEKVAVALLSAAWVWGALPVPPARHSICRAVTRRVPMRVGRRAVVHDLVLGEGDLVELAGVPVTSPARTLEDLARRSGADEERAARQLVELGIADPAAVLVRLRSRGRIPATRRAAALLTELASQADVTR